MNFKDSINTLITETIIPDFGDDDIENIPNNTLLSNLSSYMYDTILDVMISNEQYSKDIDNLQFNYQQINEMISYLTDLNPAYRKKCILLCYIFLKIRDIDTPIVTPAFSLDDPNIPKPLSWGSFRTSISGYLPGMPTFSMPRNPFGRSTSEPETEPEPETGPETGPETEPGPAPGPEPGPEPEPVPETDMSELLFIAGLLMLLDEDDFKPS